ncbi:hypothetical protein BGZ73_000796 [Actinomortierella ambigua]|nr:hypothetical protein BGZ73_000796 [Actinomortierella ambigua]
MERKLVALENNSEHYCHADDNQRRELQKHGKLIKAYEVVSAELFYTTLREEIQASAPIQLSPLITGDERTPNLPPSSSPLALATQAELESPTTAIAIATVAAAAAAASSRLHSDGVSTACQGYEPSEQSFSDNHPCAQEQLAENIMLETGASIAPTEHPRPSAIMILPQNIRQESGSNRDQVQDRSSPDSLVLHPLQLPAQIQYSLSPPPTAPALDELKTFQDWDCRIERSGPSEEADGVKRSTTGTTLLGALPYSESLYSASSCTQLSSSEKSTQVSGTMITPEHSPRITAASTSASHPISSHRQEHPQHEHCVIPSLSRASTTERVTRARAGLGARSGGGAVVEAGTGAGVGPGPPTRRRSAAPALTASTSQQNWSESMPTRPQPSRNTLQHTFIPMQPLGRPQSHEFDKVSTISTTTTFVQPTAPIAAISTAVGMAPTTPLDRQWDEAQFEQVALRLNSLLEEYEELSNRILESLILAATSTTDVSALGPELGYGNCGTEDAQYGGSDIKSSSRLGFYEIPGNNSSHLTMNATISSQKGKSRQQVDSPFPFLAPEPPSRELDLDHLPMHRFEGRPWPRGLLQRQRLARSATIWIAAEWPKIYAAHQRTTPPMSVHMIQRHSEAVACIKDAISTLWALDNQFHEKSIMVLDIMRDPEELTKDAVRILKSRHLDYFTEATTLSAAQIDRLDQQVKADYDRRQKLSEPLNNIWVSLLMLESDTAKATLSGGASPSFPGSLSALFSPMSFSAMSSTTSMNQQQQLDAEQDSHARRPIILRLSRNKRFAIKVAILLLLGSFLIGMGLLVNTRS